MRVCVTSSGKELSSAIDPRFGRCYVFVIVDTDTMQFEAVDNPALGARGGAGTWAGRLMTEQKVEAVLTGNVGPNAFNVLQAAGITIYTGVSGTVEDALGQLRDGSLTAVGAPSAAPHSGMQR